MSSNVIKFCNSHLQDPAVAEMVDVIEGLLQNGSLAYRDLFILLRSDEKQFKKNLCRFLSRSLNLQNTVTPTSLDLTAQHNHKEEFIDRLFELDDHAIRGTTIKLRMPQKPLDLTSVMGLASNELGLFVVDPKAKRVVHLAFDGRTIAKWGDIEHAILSLSSLHGIAVNRTSVFVTDMVREEVFVFDMTGKLLASWGGLEAPIDIAADSSNVYVLENTAHRVSVFSPTGVKKNSAQRRILSNLEAIALDDDFVYVQEGNITRVLNKITLDLKKTFIFNEQVKAEDVAVDDSNLYISDGSSNRIIILDKRNGARKKIIDVPDSVAPRGIAVHDGVLYVADATNSQIKIIT